MHEAVFKHSLLHHRASAGEAGNCGQLGLHIGWEGWIRLGDEVKRTERIVGLAAHCCCRCLDGASSVLQHLENSREQGRVGVGDSDVAASDRRSAQVGASLDSVGQDAVRPLCGCKA